jgi:nucleoside-diphosphate-sugar epimerase
MVDTIQKALITGGTGYIGSNLARYLVHQGWEVHLIIRPDSKQFLIQDIIESITIHIHHGSTQEMIEIMDKARPTVVFHLASLFLAQHSSKDIEGLIQSNILFSTQLVEAMTVTGINYLINTGTSWQHYQNSDYNPVCLYAATKQAFEDIITYYTETTSLKAITLKLFDTFGPKDPRNKLLSLLCKAANDKISLSMSPGEQLIDLVYIDDVLEAFLQAAENLLSGRGVMNHCYAVSSGNPLKLQDVVKVFERVTRRKLQIHWGGRPYREREVMIPWNKYICLPGWYPKISLEDGLRKIDFKATLLLVNK